jgi:hypothetical protein
LVVIRSNFVTVVAFVFCAMGGVGAATVWESKPFNTWTDAELTSLITSSPWAGPGSIQRVKKDGTLGRMGDNVVVSWTTALPMRQAVARERIGFNGPVTKEVETFLSTPLDAFLVAVKVIGSADAMSLAAQAGRAQTSTFLTPRDKIGIVALQGEGHLIDAKGNLLTAAPAGQEGQAVTGGSLLVFAFARTGDITAKDREVEFASQLGDFVIRRTFHVNDMIYNGKLEL